MNELHTGISIIGAKRKTIKIKVSCNHQSMKPFYNSSCLILNYWSKCMNQQKYFENLVWNYSENEMNH